MQVSYKSQSKRPVSENLCEFSMQNKQNPFPWHRYIKQFLFCYLALINCFIDPILIWNECNSIGDFVLVQIYKIHQFFSSIFSNIHTSNRSLNFYYARAISCRNESKILHLHFICQVVILFPNISSLLFLSNNCFISSPSTTNESIDPSYLPASFCHYLSAKTDENNSFS